MGTWCAELCKPLLVSPSAVGMFACLALHKKLLYAGGEDGSLSQLVVKGDHALVTDTISVGAAVTSLSFNPSHYKLAVTNAQVCSAAENAGL